MEKKRKKLENLGFLVMPNSLNVYSTLGLLKTMFTSNLELKCELKELLDIDFIINNDKIYVKPHPGLPVEALRSLQILAEEILLLYLDTVYSYCEEDSVCE